MCNRGPVYGKPIHAHTPEEAVAPGVEQRKLKARYDIRNVTATLSVVLLDVKPGQLADDIADALEKLMPVYTALGEKDGA